MPMRIGRPRLTPLRCVLGGLFALACASLFFHRTPRLARVSPFTLVRTWNGWSTVDYLFIFGDSWSTIDFNANLTQPNRNVPWGNPEDPVKEGDISSNGPNWTMLLTSTHNQSFIRTYNLAHGAATVDREVRPPHPLLNHTYTLEEQVEQIFQPLYAPRPTFAKWNSRNSLFIIFCGMVDIVLSVRDNLETDTNWGIAESYFNSMELLYDLGARNMMILLAPPMNLGPAPEQDTTLMETFVNDLNSRLLLGRQRFIEAHSDVRLFVFDTNAFLKSLLDDPMSMDETSDIKNLTEFCEAYNPNTTEIDTFKHECGVPVNQYFWLNQLHTTYPVHNATAAAIVRDCLGRKTRGFCSG